MEVNTCGVTLVVSIRIKGRFCFKAYLVTKLQKQLSIAHELMLCVANFVATVHGP